MLSVTQSKSTITCLMTQNLCPATHAVMDGSVQGLQRGFQMIPLQQEAFRQAQQSRDFISHQKLK